MYFKVQSILIDMTSPLNMDSEISAAKNSTALHLVLNY